MIDYKPTGVNFDTKNVRQIPNLKNDKSHVERCSFLIGFFHQKDKVIDMYKISGCTLPLLQRNYPDDCQTL